MSIQIQIIVNVLCFSISFFDIRCFLYGIKRYQLNNSAYKKKKKGETFKEWMLYSRYKAEIPKILLTLYYCILLIHFLCLVACTFCYILNLPLEVGSTLVKIVAGFDATWIIITNLLFWSPRREYAYGRWITKKRKGHKGQGDGSLS